MKKMKVVTVLISAVMMVSLLAACGGGSMGSDLEEDLGESLAEGLTGADIETGDEWPDEMPAKVPEMKDGKIVSSSLIMVGGNINATVGLENVTETEFENYAADVESAGFNIIVSAASGGIDSRTYGMGENALSLQFAAKSGELLITYTGE